MSPVRSRGERAALTEFGGRVRARRDELGLSQEKFARRVPLDRSYVTEIESGARNIGLLNVLRVAAALERRLSTFLRHPGREISER